MIERKGLMGNSSNITNDCHGSKKMSVFDEMIEAG